MNPEALQGSVGKHTDATDRVLSAPILLAALLFAYEATLGIMGMNTRKPLGDQMGPGLVLLQYKTS